MCTLYLSNFFYYSSANYKYEASKCDYKFLIKSLTRPPLSENDNLADLHAKEVIQLILDNSITIDEYVKFYKEAEENIDPHYSSLQKSIQAHKRALDKIRMSSLFTSFEKDPFSAIYSYPGISIKALLINSDNIIKSWESTSLDQAVEGLGTQLMSFVELNKQASYSWENIINSCYQNSLDENEKVKQLRVDYFNKSISCGRNQNRIQREIKQLIGNVKAWLGINADISETENYFTNMQGVDFSELNLPTMHPLLGQILIELYAKSRLVLAKYYVDNFSQDSEYQSMEEISSSIKLDLSNLKFKCITSKNNLNSSQAKACKSASPILMAFHKIENLFKNHNKDCQNYGLAPNASLYMLSQLGSPISIKPTHESSTKDPFGPFVGGNN